MLQTKFAPHIISISFNNPPKAANQKTRLLCGSRRVLKRRNEEKIPRKVREEAIKPNPGKKR